MSGLVKLPARAASGRLAPDEAARTAAGAIGRFGRDEKGAIAIMFAFTAMIAVALVGGAVDYGRWLNAKNQTQNAIDAAVLAAGRVLQTTNGNQAQALEAARRSYAQMKSLLTTSDSIDFQIVDGGVSVVGSTTAVVSTPFLATAGVISLEINAVGKAELAVGGNSETNIEVSMMLDVTGSMAGSKIADLRTAAKDLIDIVVWADQSQYTSRVALTPFAPRINVGSKEMASALTGLPATSGSNNLRSCVTERTGADAFTDEAPAAGRYLGQYARNSDGTNKSSSYQYSSSGNCSSSDPAPSMMALSADKTALKARIDTFNTYGATAGWLGHAWAWYMLSPKWNAVWTGTSTPGSYADLTTYGSAGQPRLQKIAVLMTDGEYNTRYGSNCGSSCVSSVSSNALQICTNMKAAGITVYTIGFMLDNPTATNTLRDCATSTAHFYPSSTGEELRTAFRDIALKIATLRISR